MEIKQLRAFLTVAETGNVTRAAEILHLVQPAVSRQLLLLEEDIGTPLFQRERRGMALTAAGQTLVAYARRVMLELDRARVEIEGEATGVVGGLVTLGLLPSTIDMLCSDLVGVIAARYPGIRIRLAMGYAGTLLRWLEAGEIDAALLYGVESSPDVKMRPLIDEPLWVIGPPEAQLKPKKPVSLGTLVNQKLILPSAPHGIRTLVEHACAVSNVTLQVSTETNALSVQRILVLRGHGWTILPPISVADDLRAGRLCGAPLADPAITRTIAMALPTNRPTGRHVECAVEVLVDVARQAIKSRAWLEGHWLGDASDPD